MSALRKMVEALRDELLRSASANERRIRAEESAWDREEKDTAIAALRRELAGRQSMIDLCASQLRDANDKLLLLGEEDVIGGGIG